MNELEQRVYKKLLRVPKGKVTTYGDLAKAVGIKNGQRVIGQIMNKNPFPVIIPCHRVVNSDGKIGGYFYGQNVKTEMLSKEGVTIKDGKIQNWEKTLFRF
ncbi:MAG: MGMT family protein [Candidatus Nitrosotenuis sp.]|uniref:Methylated-DNA--protein-cysteine methyltransferase n=1 Tax=Candidatus Nitrosotenuis uzonensis TaxID=1407055 RepID=V6AS34_9ARCH|nr:MGMT family protein [Candidatus Nitrosotenuis uzonensis]MCA2003627.1 MGMT family protein [Candidatus Nitrosotenuis sp.]CAE6485387.1 Methylated-DNA--protein-cysteine methyltransferase [Candidatus Nitrosotenuis uzonensis]CDI05228.1 Methylated-DNA--protein-cysteine methyltransferase [Candidatus Nitrosotenuis uzonensis]